MACIYAIKDWHKHFENNRTRELKKLDWVPIPNKQDGDGYTELMSFDDGPALFGAWIAIVQIASKCLPRGTLVRDGGFPHTSQSLARMSRVPAGLLTRALSILLNIGWLESTPYENPAGGCENPAGGCASRARAEGKGREGNEGKGREDPGAPRPAAVVDIFDTWNAMAGVALPQCLVVSDKRRRQIEARLRDQFFVNNWREAMARIRTLAFCNGKNDRSWRASFDWFLQPDVCAKVMEGKYDKVNGHSFEASTTETATIREL